MRQSNNAGRDRAQRRRVLLGMAGLAATGLVATSLTGCALPGSGPPPQRVRLNPATSFPPNMPSAGWKLVVSEPSATLSINTARIMVIDRAGTIQYLANGEWASRAPEMVMELLVESFQNSNRILTVGDRRSRIRPDFELESRLTAFQIVAESPTSGVVHVSLDASLLQRPQRNVLSSLPFSSSAEVNSRTLEAVFAAFDGALQDVMSQVVEWTLVTGAGA